MATMFTIELPVEYHQKRLPIQTIIIVPSNHHPIRNVNESGFYQTPFPPFHLPQTTIGIVIDLPSPTISINHDPFTLPYSFRAWNKIAQKWTSTGFE